MGKSELRIGIVGSRRRNTYSDRKIVCDIIVNLVAHNPNRKIVIVSGACPKGADKFAADAARLLNVELKEYPVPRDVTYPNKWAFAQAAFARNRLIAEDSFVGYALVSADRTGGTENTVGHYLDLMKPIFLVNDVGGIYLPSGEEVPYEHAFRDPDKGRATSSEVPVVGSKD